MKSLKLAFALLILTLALVIANSIILNGIISDIEERISSAEEKNFETALLEYEEIYENFKKKEVYISLTVSHDDLTRIEDGFAEIIGAAKAEDEDGVITAKSRLKESLGHLRRLSGINISSIF